jgi:hypothetical protein
MGMDSSCLIVRRRPATGSSLRRHRRDGARCSRAALCTAILPRLGSATRIPLVLVGERLHPGPGIEPDGSDAGSPTAWPDVMLTG